MKIYDISQELLNCNVFPGDKKPQGTQVSHIAQGSLYNLTNIAMCVHNGTHVDSPYHFIDNGKTIDELDLNKCIGLATVVEANGELTQMHIKELMSNSEKRLLIKGDITISLEAAIEMNNQGINLIGVEGLTVGPMNTPLPIHVELLSKEVVIIEGLRLSHVPCGNYFLFSAPLNIAGADGSPCRSILVEGLTTL